MIPQIKYYRQRFIKYAIKNGVTKASIRYKISRKTIYKWLKRYDGTLESLEDLSRRPKNSPKKHTEEEIKIINKLINKYGNDIILIYQILKEKYNYTKTYGGLKNLIRKLLKPVQNKKVTPKWKEYKRADYIGQKVQLDVKYVPSECILDGKKYYQYTAVDECSRWCYRQIYEEKSTYTSYLFILELIKKSPFIIREIQTDNGVEFTNLQRKEQGETMFEMILRKLDIKYTRTRIATPRHNGKVERQHRQDSERFYKYLKMFNLEDGRKQLAKYQVKSNNYIKTCLGFKSPNQVVEQYLGVF